MSDDTLSLVEDGGKAHENLRAAYLARLVAPMDDMWNAFADQAQHYALQEAGDTIGSCAVDDEKQLLRFHVREDRSTRAVELLGLVRDQLAISRVMVGTLDPFALAPALDLAASVRSHSYFFDHVCEPELEGLPGIALAPPDMQERIIAFEEEAIGAPRAFLEMYVGERIARRELYLHGEKGEIGAVGELRRDPIQPGIAQLGVIVHPEARRRGLAGRMLTQLVHLARKEELHPICSTELTNTGARRAIERAGFRAHHRWLAVELRDS